MAVKGLAVYVDPIFYQYKDALDKVAEACQYISFVKSRKKENDEEIYYLNVPAVLDIEVTSTTVDKVVTTKRKTTTIKEPVAFMYIWQMEINGVAFYGRTWDEWGYCMDRLAEIFELDATHRLIIGVHNLAYEFQFIRKRIHDPKVFAIDSRRPVRVTTSDGFEFRCTYILSGLSLKKVGESLPACTRVEKLDGDKYDYKKIRTSVTPLTAEELKYCENDVRIVGAYLRKKIQEDGDISKILLTNTSYVRQYVRRHTIYNKDKKTATAYKKLISKLTIEREEYNTAYRAFSGGFTHANPEYIGEIVTDVDSIDFTSSYPSVMIAELYPMSKGVHIENPKPKQITKYSDCGYVSILNIKITGLKSRETVPDNILSLSKCYTDKTYTSKLSVDDCITSNGRIVEAFDDVEVYTTVTSVDLIELLKFYEPEKITVLDMWYYRAMPLPTEFVKCIIYFYKLKTELKDVEGQEDLYQWAKGMLNSLYGMCVTNILRDPNEYIIDEWEEGRKLDEEEKTDALNDYNTSKSRFLSYLWGVFVTAYARRNVYTGLLEFGSDYLYADTDSNKVKNIKNHMTYIRHYNTCITTQIRNMLNKHGIDPKDATPLDKHGNPHPLGVWDWETENNNYKRFCTYGAKRYICEVYDKKKGKLVRKMTVAGLPKKAIDKIEEREGRDAFEVLGEALSFENGELEGGYSVNPADTCKQLITYIDEEKEADITDYNGVTAHVHEYTAAHMQDNNFNFGLDVHFMRYLQGYRSARVI